MSRSPPLSGIPASTANRVVSNSSVSTGVSIGTTISADTPQTSFLHPPTTNETYEAVLKVVLLEYKNEPRFRVVTRSVSPVAPLSPSPSHNLQTVRSSTTDRTKRHSWFHHSSPEADKIFPSEAVPKLKKTLTEIAMGKNKEIQDPLTKRCFLHLYNDLLRPGVSIDNVEELLMMFIAASTKEIKLYSEASKTQTSVFQQADVFISVMLSILKTCKNSEWSMLKLQESRKNLKKGPLTSTNSPSVPSQVSRIKPTYRLSEISGAKILGDMFSVDEVRLQQDIIRLKDISNEETLIGDLVLLSEKLKKNKAMFNPDDFDHYDLYFAWKKEEKTKLDELISKLAGKSNIPPSSKQSFIPSDARTALSDLLVKAFAYGGSDIATLSNFTKSLVESCCTYWRIHPVSQATLTFQAAHYTILKSSDNDLDPEKTEALFGVLYRLLAEAPHPQLWSKVDKKVWVTNLSNSYIQVMVSIRGLLTSIYDTRAPKFSRILKILYEYIEQDPLYDIILKSDLPQRWVKRLKNTILATTEAKYVEILEGIPRDNSLDLIHIKETAENIYKTIQQLQKKFPKSLFDSILIANESANLFLKLYSEDVKNMLAHIEHYSLKGSSHKISAADALDVYAELRDLRDIYNQIKPRNSKFAFDLEGFFFKYLEELCDVSAKKIFPVVKESLECDSFEPLNLQNDIGYSSSVLDIFKMINEIFSVFKKYMWANETQMAVIYTRLLKAVSDSIVYYSARIKIMIMDDLKETDSGGSSPSLSKDEKRKSTWLFTEMKAAVSGNSRLPPPKPYSFKSRTCVALNNLSQILKQLRELESQLDPESIKLLASAASQRPSTKVSNNVFTVRIVKAENIKPAGSDGLSNSYVVLMDSTQRREIGKTKTIPKSLNPLFEEDFEFEQSDNSTKSITATVWNQGSKLSSQDLLGRTVLQLDPKKFRNDGIPEEVRRDLDIQGTLVFQVSLESEKDDDIFSIGKANRSILRTMEKSFAMIVDKFSVFISNSFSRQTLRTICGSIGTRAPTSDEVKDAIIPLFDYLNSNLQVLANTLDNDILLKVMVQTWRVILHSADDLILPALASVKVFTILLNNSTWKDSLSNAVANVTNSVTIPGYGRSLTGIEVDAIFVWLNSLCDFFHNDGAGPAMDQLKDEYYQRLLLVQKFYDETPAYLKGEVEMLTPLVLKAIKAKNFLGDESDSDVLRTSSLARSNTIVAFGSSKRRAAAQEATKDSDKFTGTFQIYTEDIILRVLLGKGEREFVHRRLTEREKMAHSFATERLARLAVRGKRH